MTVGVVYPGLLPLAQSACDGRLTLGANCLSCSSDGLTSAPVPGV